VGERKKVLWGGGRLSERQKGGKLSIGEVNERQASELGQKRTTAGKKERPCNGGHWLMEKKGAEERK